MAKFDSSVLQVASKQDIINAVIKAVYENSKPLAISQKERKEIERLYKARYVKCKTLHDFIKNDVFLQSVIGRVQSVRNYIENQISKGKALQPGILSECIFVHTLAQCLGCNTFADATDSMNQIPKHVIAKIDLIKASSKDCVAARWFYYDSRDPEKLVVQYGNPENKDASIVIFMHEVILEIKDMPAVYNDKDLYYDENGKLIVTDEIHNDYPEYEMIINDFNAKTSVFDELGHNWPLNMSLLQPLLFGGNNDFDLLLTSKNDRLLVLKKADLAAMVKGKPVINLRGSEIRTTGKNSAKVFTPNKMLQIFANAGIHDHLGVWFAPEANIIGPVMGRGKNEVTRIRLTPCFYLKAENVVYINKHYSFNGDNVLQTKCGISIHLNIDVSPKDIYAALYKGRV